MEKKTNVWKVIGIIFISITAFFFIATIALSAFYAVSRQDASNWKETNAMQKDTLSSKRQWLKSLGVLNKPFSEDYYSATRNYARVKRHYIGESVTLGTGEQMTVTSLKYDADIKLKDASDNDKTAVLSVNIKNTKSRPIQFNIKDFYVLDNIYDLAKLSSDSRNKKGTSVIQPGQTIKTKVYFTIPKEGPYLVIYGKDYWMPNSDERQGSSSNSL